MPHRGKYNLQSRFDFDANSFHLTFGSWSVFLVRFSVLLLRFLSLAFDCNLKLDGGAAVGTLGLDGLGCEELPIGTLLEWIGVAGFAAIMKMMMVMITMMMRRGKMRRCPVEPLGAGEGAKVGSRALLPRPLDSSHPFKGAVAQGRAVGRGPIACMVEEVWSSLPGGLAWGRRALRGRGRPRVRVHWPFGFELSLLRGFPRCAVAAASNNIHTQKPKNNSFMR